MRKEGARSKDSGFRSPHTMRTETPVSVGGENQQQIYSISNKVKKNRQHEDDDRFDRRGAVSPTPTTGSMGQRSVKTTTTTMSADLADRPLSRNVRSSQQHKRSSSMNAKDRQRSGDGAKVSKPPSPFQKLAKLFSPSNQKSKQQVAT